MRYEKYLIILLSLVVMTVVQGCDSKPDQALGTLEWDRVNSRAPASEVIVAIHVQEGQFVKAGELLITMDDAKMREHYQDSEAQLKEASWKLQELESGPRPQTIAETRARLEAAQATLKNDREIYERRKKLYTTDFTSEEQRDNSYNRYINSRQRVAELTESLDKLLEGTRFEQIEQARSRVASLKARVAGLELLKMEYLITASRDGMVDSLPYKKGDRPPAQAVVCTLLAGDQPWARIYVPEGYRSQMKPGEQFKLTIDGQQGPFNVRLRAISSEASFTPYYALSENDRSRLSFVGQFDLIDERARELTAGTPVQLILESM